MQAYRFDHVFRELDAFEETARGWNLDFRQLDPGLLKARLLQVGAGPTQISRATLGRRLLQRGSSPANTRTFAILEERTLDLEWCRRQISPAMLLAFPPDDQFEGISQPGFDVHTVAVAEDHLADLAEALGLGHATDLLDKVDQVFQCDPAAMERLRAELRLLSQNVAQDPAPLPDLRLRQALERDVPGLILTALASTVARHDQPAPRLRDLALRRAEDYIEAFAEEAFTIEELCKAAGASERTLQYAFRGKFGISPKAFLQSHRLNAVRRDLRDADPGFTMVSDVANFWGYWHMGQFAADYARFFGELPSVTLKAPARPSRTRARPGIRTAHAALHHGALLST
jgi:AraC-like DNA-binding protein